MAKIPLPNDIQYFEKVLTPFFIFPHYNNSNLLYILCILIGCYVLEHQKLVHKDAVKEK